VHYQALTCSLLVHTGHEVGRRRWCRRKQHNTNEYTHADAETSGVNTAPHRVLVTQPGCILPLRESGSQEPLNEKKIISLCALSSGDTSRLSVTFLPMPVEEFFALCLRLIGKIEVTSSAPVCLAGFPFWSARDTGVQNIQ
jgi:hypothetical protein